MNKLGITALVISIVALGVAVILPPYMQHEQDAKKDYDFSVIRINNSGCELKGSNGEALNFEEQKGQGRVMIPKGSTITGDCFLVESEK
ncbi:hypothetical protein A11A3_14000 [Alcanivorax hongdengensis A-11-3]|uniref:Uncharacterized protein n=1 Tax=Alcanivorax hongdengensis A-11-3 TaxID=1177179 RepID=L0W9G3_9GAMM|nr:hypothetical protein [Alcanivorax hongdengensis]EKF73373.1 hypothetical protein A11A3_14000 [Alcanivorax hongdengensis A-11-3]